MGKVLKVYIDTNVLKFSATQLPRLRPRPQKINWGGRIHEITVHDFVNIDPNDSIRNPELKAEAELLPELAEAGKRGQLKYVIQMETLFESWGIPNMDSATGRFYGAPYETVDAPIAYARVIAGGRNDPKDMQFAGGAYMASCAMCAGLGATAGCGKTRRDCHSEEVAAATDEESRTAMKMRRARSFATLRMTAKGRG